MARIAGRERQRFSVQSGDWRVPIDFESSTGVLVTRIRPGEYGVFMNGRWRAHTVQEWQRHFDTPVLAGLPTGWWAIMPKLHNRSGSYVETFNRETLCDALNVAARQLMGAYAPRKIRVA